MCLDRKQVGRQTSMQIHVYLYEGAWRRLSPPRATRISAPGLCPDPVKIHLFECSRSPPLIFCAHILVRVRAISRAPICLCVYRCMYAIPGRSRAPQTLVVAYAVTRHCTETFSYMSLFCEPPIRVGGSKCRPLRVREAL